MIEALLDIRIPDLWDTPVTEKYNIKLSCQIGGHSGKAGWGIVTIKGEDKNLDKILREIRKHPSVGRIRIKTRQEDSVSFLVDVVKCKPCEILVKSKVFMVFPIEIQNGRMKWLLITDTNRTMGRISDKLEESGCDVKITRVTPLGEKGILTKRQEEIIRTAFESGYFNYPRRVDSSKLADKLGISVSTFSEVMRATQRRIFAEYLRS